uniref:Phosducin domain-containing protein n=1 Tax=Aplanochytrium stocchinoi TaxID=215587 RepID=A0A7S3PR85_9STRA|mmetsp:Transcript_8970/g.11260  ORF Transcript_8970/g.11260 Transcript_8970/m.11260 type:complete len:350 (+) Transcript_8970:105-1154(+)|eukprot:CAMPEP_0204821962 /NCGR_PEP_ID=MMETSP1346-20131115/157_1 /ASSEMBLY_ACC=CAM_ASM_000771 /TAXON_ID=215587 /ORGANISM="Aplanochytrium stocchinoi, Strain GSBS06" /LENGTH=349 /DNA_ID=CAMNT_0051947945 /DNA_START=235 /DNA_END=1281 /DNA_ORIENTATION=-
MSIISNELERKYLTQDLLQERDSDEDGGEKTRYVIDSDFSWSSEEENAKPVKEDAPHPDRDWSKLLTKQRKYGNTGPKGVKADYEEAQRIIRRQNETKVLKDREEFRRQALGNSSSGTSLSYASQKKGISGSLVKSYDADDEIEIDDGEAIILKMRKMRLQQMKELAALPQWGRVLQVSKFQFVDEVDKADPRTPVVVHLFEDYINACRRMNDILDRLASKHPFIKFIKLKATDADQTLSHSALPAFMVYVNGQLVNEAGVNVVNTEIGNDLFTDTDVEWLLAAKYGINIPGVDISAAEKDSAGIEKHAAQAQADKEGAVQNDDGYISLTARRLYKANRDEDDEDNDSW